MLNDRPLLGPRPARKVAVRHAVESLRELAGRCALDLERISIAEVTENTGSLLIEFLWHWSPQRRVYAESFFIFTLI